MRSHREDILGLSRLKVSSRTGVVKKILTRLEHAVKKQFICDIRPVIEFYFKLPDDGMAKYTDKGVMALELLDLSFPTNPSINQEVEVPQPLLCFLQIFYKRNKPRVRRFRRLPRKKKYQKHQRLKLRFLAKR